MLEGLRNIESEVDALGEINYSDALSLNLKHRPKIERAQIIQYHSNIESLSENLHMIEEHGRKWKPYQYLALMFAEHYLARYFDDADGFCRDLNDFKNRHRLLSTLVDYEPDDLRTIAIQSATGSGKTLIMQANVLQFRHYLDTQGHRLNNVVLLTPNEQMSRQHEREMRESGLNARLFTPESTSELHATIEIVDLNKLAEKTGIKRISVKEFGNNNLVLVDEGHLGATGKVWRSRRQELSRSGFTFEYSATFNQIAKDRTLRDSYGKCLLFDYSYRQFYEDGYGKDYHISNLPSGMIDTNSHLYLLGCLLTFYQQLRIWNDNHSRWTEFNLTKPLWVFLGKTVTGSSTADQETKSDVVQILNFLSWVLSDQNTVRSSIVRLLAGQSGLVDDTGNDFFTNGFHYLNQNSVHDIYLDICNTLFHGPGQLRAVYLTDGEGEIHLHSADNDTFGVINVGDSTALYKLLNEYDNPNITLERELGFRERLFAKVDDNGSQVNIVIGARRFIAGWNSWRVSTMGLMHVGVGEGPEIIQMFGRGIRLKGWNMSLKRHVGSGARIPSDSEYLMELEKLYIFGLRANYIQTFRDLLALEGMQTERETYSLPVKWNFSKGLKLQTLKIQNDIDYRYSHQREKLPGPGSLDSPHITLDLYSKVRSIESVSEDQLLTSPELPIHLKSTHVALLNTTRIYDRIIRIKQQKNWHNLHIESDTIETLVKDSSWYSLLSPDSILAPQNLKDLQRLENIMVNLLTEYIDQFWRKARRRWEQGFYEITSLEKDNPNILKEYLLSVDANDHVLAEGIQELIAKVDSGEYRHLKLGVIQTSHHAYQPLLYADDNCEIAVQPAALNQGEKKLVVDLTNLVDRNNEMLQGNEVHLLRNLTGSRGISFFDDFKYYPDFILWITGKQQHMVFLDPKGLMHFGKKEIKKVGLHHKIKDIEQVIQSKNANLKIHSYILSRTPAQRIGEGDTTEKDWNKKGVYFMERPTYLLRIIHDVLGIQ